MKKIRFLLILLLATAMAVPAGLAEGTGGTGNADAPSMVRKTFPVYAAGNGTEPVKDAFPLYFADGVDDLPYVDISDLLALLNDPDDPEEEQLTCEFDPEAETATIHLGGSDSVLWFDFAGIKAAYSSFDTYSSLQYDSMLDNLSVSGFNGETGAPELFRRIPNAMMQREGSPLVISLKDYDIPMIHRDSLFLLPLHTAFDLIFGIPSGGHILCFNGQGIFVGTQQMLEKDSDLGRLYYSARPPVRSPQLAAYGVNELCMELDHFYGLKEAHGIGSFYELIASYSGLAAQLLDTNANEADKGLALLLKYCLDDGHSNYIANSWMTGASPEDNPESVGNGFSGGAWENAKWNMEFMRDRYPESVKPYFEVGNTAYIYTDEFNMSFDDPGKYYNGITEEDLADDTVALIIWAHRQINRENSPIENVVIDLSNNIGGAADAAIFLMGWFLGEAPFSAINPLTGAQRTALYRADVNLDREFDEKDTLQEKNLYCLVSRVSFSCGNLVPCVFRSSGKVTLIGDTTGGGSCIVLQMASAWGSLFQISGPKQISFVKNGAYYDTDRGVDPTVFLTKTESICDRVKLTEFINSLR